MKTSLILLSCLVAISSQQRIFFNAPFSPRIGYLPYLYGVYSGSQQFLFDSENESNQVADEQPEGDSLARSMFPHLQAQNKFLLANPLSIFNWFSSTTTTATVVSTATYWTTANSTVTTTTLQLCVPLASFAGNAGAESTTPCARRRREVALLTDASESIHPSEIELVESSAVPELPQERQTSDEQLLVSSKDDQVQESLAPLRRTGRAATVTSTFVVTVTSTNTGYQFVPTVVPKTVDLGADLKCLPPGLAVCK